MCLGNTERGDDSRSVPDWRSLGVLLIGQVANSGNVLGPGDGRRRCSNARSAPDRQRLRTEHVQFVLHHHQPGGDRRTSGA
jgi:hypothetical protein